MLLTIDVGNTQTVLGLFDGQTLTHHWRISTNDERTSDEMALLVSELLRLRGIEFHPEELGIAVSSVVPRNTAALRQMADEWFGVKAVVLEPGTRMGMPILYDNPKEVGADRIANAVGAYDRYGGPSIVVDFGTATTFDAISAKGEYLGGAIIPGIEISLDALFGRAEHADHGLGVADVDGEEHQCPVPGIGCVSRRALGAARQDRRRRRTLGGPRRRTPPTAFRSGEIGVGSPGPDIRTAPAGRDRRRGPAPSG